MNKVQRALLAKEKAEDAKRASAAAVVARRIGLPVEASRGATFWENTRDGRDPIATRDPFSHMNAPRGYRALPIACRLKECDVVLRALAALAEEMGVRWRIELGKEERLSFDVLVKKSEMAAFRDAAQRLAGKFGAYVNLFYAGAEPWGAEISRQVYFHD